MKTIEKVQCIYFDMCDLMLNNPQLSSLKIKGFYEFKTLKQFFEEQRERLSEIESALDFETNKE